MPSIKLDVSNWTTSVPHGIADFQASAVRLFFKAKTEVSDRDWSLVVRDRRSLRVLAMLGAKDFEDTTGQLSVGRWTGRLPTADVQVDLIASSSSDVVIEIREGLALPAEATGAKLFSIQGVLPNWKDLYTAPDLNLRRAGDVVGILITGAAAPPGLGDPSTWCCSGVMVANDLFMTNWHCGGTARTPIGSMWNEDVCGRSLIDLSWDNGFVSRQYNCVAVVAKSDRLDYAILRIRPVIGTGGAAGTPRRAAIDLAGVQAGATIFMVHHALCKPKLVSTGCSVVAARRHASLITGTPGAVNAAAMNPEFTHVCDTEPGASGAPVFASNGGLVGLHHSGFDRNDSCEAIDGVNKAIRIDEIVAHLRSIDAELVKEMGLD